MSEKVLKEWQIREKLEQAEKDLLKAEDKFNKAKADVEKFQQALDVFNLLSSDKEVQSGYPSISEERKIHLAKLCMSVYGGMANYKQIHEYIIQNEPQYQVTPQSTYSFIKRMIAKSPSLGIEFLDKGLFRLIQPL